MCPFLLSLFFQEKAASLLRVAFRSPLPRRRPAVYVGRHFPSVAPVSHVLSVFLFCCFARDLLVTHVHLQVLSF